MLQATSPSSRARPRPVVVTPPERLQLVAAMAVRGRIDNVAESSHAHNREHQLGSEHLNDGEGRQAAG